jgi:PAS domain S-box
MAGPTEKTRGAASATSAVSDPFYGGGEAGAILRAIDWSKRTIGPVETWPQSLRTALSIGLASRHPICILWGPERLYFYNDAYTPIVGAKHPWALGESYITVWPEIWDSVIRPILENVEATGQASWADDLLLVLRRHGYNEECYFSFSFAPTRIEDGSVGGVFTAVTETTMQVVGERRLRTLRDLGVREPTAKTAEHACEIAAEVLAENQHDVPFALFYLVEQDGRAARRVTTMGVTPTEELAPETVSLLEDGEEDPWDFRETIRTGEARVREKLAERFGELHAGPWPEPVETAVVLPIARPGERVPYGFLVSGTSPRRPLDHDYRGFLGLAAGQVATAVSNVLALAEERRRAEALAELDRAKTDFFSNVSHEFRTPLTLMLGPLEELLNGREGDALPGAVRRQLDVAHRNSLRLLKLVNSLLDFSRIEAGRIRASYEPVDLAAFTAELAGVFRAAIEKAGLSLVVACEPTPEPAYVDRDMWEKIVFNLISNAYKFTLRGEILVHLQTRPECFELRVRDTGTGIAPEHQQTVFKRFQRVENAFSRTHEGSGIGLALVRELARLHGGDVVLESASGEGSTFIVSIPRGHEHLPADRLGASRDLASTAVRGEAFVEESLRWLREETKPPEMTAGGGGRARVLVADDNADMREYVARLLQDGYEVRTAADGAEALEIVRRWTPELVLSDVMMPGMDGVALTKALRADPATRELPVVLLSARAGEEARIEGLETGADDYLTKPFSGRELLARVHAHLQLARSRREAAMRVTAAEGRYRAIFEQASVGIFECDLDGKILRANPALAALLGFSRDELLGRNWRDLVPADDLPTNEVVAAKLVRGETPSFAGERRFRRKDGEEGWVDIFATVVLDDAGRPGCGLGVVIDVTERKRAAARLRETEERFRTAGDNAPVLIWMTDASKRCVWCNRPWLDFVGKPLEEELGDGWQADLHPADVGRAVERFNAAFAARAPFSMEYRLRRHDGEYRWLLSRGVPRQEGGEFAGYIGSCVDIEDRRRAEQAMHASRNAERARRQEIEVLTQVAPAGIWIAHDPECRRVTGNATAHAMMRIAPGENMSLRVQDAAAARAVGFFRNGKRVPHDELPLRKAARTGKPVWNEDFELRFADGTSTWVYGSSTPLFAEDGTVRGAVCIFVDVTERRKAEQALRHSEEQLRLVTDHASVFLAQFDHQHRYRFVNRSYAERYGLTPQEVVGKHASEIAGREGYEAVRERMDRALGGERVEFELEIPIRGARRWGHVVFVPERTPDGVITGLVVVLADITQRKRAELELERARDEAVAASRAKDDFLAALSHELRTPLSPVLLLASEAATDDALPPQTRADFETIRKSVELEARLIDDLLDLTRITRGKLALDLRPTELEAVLNDALATVRAEFAAKRIELTVVPAAEPQKVKGDPVRLQQVFWNILKNAVKFTPGGGRVRIESRLDHARQRVIVDISDTGIGITPQELERVFEAFSQGDHAGHGGSHRFGGLGLGLAISRRVVELHHGRISAESAGRDHGATFRVELPLLPAEAPRTGAVVPGGSVTGRPARASVGRILLVEDHAATRAALEHLLVRRRYDVRAAGTAAEARALAGEGGFDLLISDIGLPDGNGYELMAEFRERLGLKGIALTGYGMEEDVARSRDAGFLHHLTKPVRMQALDSALAALAEATTGNGG